MQLDCMDSFFPVLIGRMCNLIVWILSCLFNRQDVKFDCMDSFLPVLIGRM